MRTIVITTQAELDTLPLKFDENTVIEIRSTAEVSVSHNYGEATVTACGSSTVTACGSSTVTACDSSTVRAYGSSTVLDLFGFAVAILWTSAIIRRKGKQAKVVRQKAMSPKTLNDWVELDAVESEGAFLTLYKRVSALWLTQEGTSNETKWEPGLTLTHANYDPESQECGPGKYHACSAPFFCDEFRSEEGDRYVAIKVAKKDCYLWPNASFQHKIAFRKGLVLHEVDVNGRKIG